jgi:adenylosuccinate synthase
MADLPRAARDYIEALEAMSGAPMSVIGVGPGRTETIAVRSLV